MKRSVAAGLLLVDVAFMGVVGQRVWLRYQEVSVPAAAPVTPVDPAPPAVIEPVATFTSTPEGLSDVLTSTGPAVALEQPLPPVTAEAAVVVSTAPASPALKRRIRFKYVNSIAKKVTLIADFNEWKGQSFRRSDSGVWTLVVEVVPGDYAYNFVVDGRTIRDPNQRRSDEKGRSLLRVNTLAPSR